MNGVYSTSTTSPQSIQNVGRAHAGSSGSDTGCHSMWSLTTRMITYLCSKIPCN